MVFLHGTTSNNNLPKFSMKVNLRVSFFLLTQSSVLWQFQENAMSICKDIVKIWQWKEDFSFQDYLLFLIFTFHVGFIGKNYGNGILVE